MASDGKKIKADPAPKAAPKAAPKSETAAKDKSTADATVSTSDGGETAAAPKNYSRGEGQKPVSKAYKDNWNAIFAKKKKR